MPGFALAPLKIALAGVLLYAPACFGAAPACVPCSPRESDDPKTLLDRGNARFRGDRSQHPRANVTCLRRLEVQGKDCQPPFAVVLSCSDSRFSPEILYDQGVGDLFVVRVAGNVATPEIMGSIEYAVNNLGVRYVVVLGHERCGAVKAAFTNPPPNIPEHLNSLWKLIRPNIQQPFDDANWDLSARRNVKATVEYLKQNLRLVPTADTTIVGAYTKLKDGEIGEP
jgi:carbonic anhydrase